MTADYLPIDQWPIPVIDRVVTADGLSILRGGWPAADSARGTVIVMNGRTEFIEKYAETAADLNGRGFDVVTWDWRGQGLSDGRVSSNPVMGHVADFEAYLDDAEAALNGGNNFPKPWILLGHSMGGHMALRAVADGVVDPEALVLSAPMVALLPSHGLPVPIIAALAWISGKIGRGESYPPGHSDLSPSRLGFEKNELTSDPMRFTVHPSWVAREPSLAVGGPSWTWLAAACRSCRYLERSASLRRLRLPVTIVQAGRETLVSNPAQEQLVARLADARLIKLDDARHEILMERDFLRDQFWAAFDETVARIGA
jgi:lysophospholipase